MVIISLHIFQYHNTQADLERGTGGPNPPRKSQVDIGFLSNSGSEHPQEAIGSIGTPGVQMLLKGGPMALLEICC